MSNVTIRAVEFTADQKLLEFINKKMEKLNQYFDRITHSEVYLRLEGKSSNIKDKTVEIKVSIPGNQLFAKSTSKVFEEAADETIDNIKRQLKKHKEKLRN